MEPSAVAAIQKRPPASLDEATKAQLKNEWQVFAEDAERVRSVLVTHAPSVDYMRFRLSLERLHTIINKE